MAISARQVDVLVTAVPLTSADTGGGEGSTVTVSPVSDIFIGGSNVTTTTGFLVKGGSAVSVDVRRRETLYGIASGTVKTYVLSSGL